MRIVVTGGSGRLGRTVVRELRASGHDVWNLDRAPAPEDAREGFIAVDLTDGGDTLSAIGGVQERFSTLDAVVHLASFPAPGLTSDLATFRNNILAGHHVVEGARRAGVKRIVHASSETVLGLPFDSPPPYLPVDEEYEARPESTYSLVKHLEEQAFRQFCRWDPELSITGLRFSNVMLHEDYARFPSFDADPRSRKWNLWGYIDARDGAQAVELALGRGPGYETFIIAAADTVMTRSSASLAAEVFPDVEVRRELGEHETLLGIDKARRLLGYAPRHSWRDEVAATPLPE